MSTGGKLKIRAKKVRKCLKNKFSYKVEDQSNKAIKPNETYYQGVIAEKGLGRS